MPSLSLTLLSPLGNDAPLTVEIGAVSIFEKTEFALASLTQRVGKSRPFNASAKRIFKTALPGPGKSISKSEYTVWWSSPEQWFVEASIESHEDIASILKADFQENASITEQSGGWCRFDLEGNASVSVLERLCAVDSATLEQDAATRTVIEHIGVFIRCRVQKQQFSIYGPRSSAGSLHHALTAAAKSVA